MSSARIHAISLTMKPAIFLAWDLDIISAATRPITPLITNVGAMYTGYPAMRSPNADPIAPEKNAAGPIK